MVQRGFTSNLISLLVLIFALLASATTVPAATPAVVSPIGSWWHPPSQAHWQIQLSGRIKVTVKADVIDVDLFDTSATTIKRLKTRNKRVICYFNAGVFESWRPDASSFPMAVRGEKLNQWPRERWLDIRQTDVLLEIMGRRMDLARQKGCDAIDPDNVDNYTQKTGFTLTADDQLRYNSLIAKAAHARGLAVGLKNDLEQIPQLIEQFDFAVNEQCFEYKECERLLPFIRAGKPVFGIEYVVETKEFCPKAKAMGFNFIKKKEKLDSWRETCR